MTAGIRQKPGSEKFSLLEGVISEEKLNAFSEELQFCVRIWVSRYQGEDPGGEKNSEPVIEPLKRDQTGKGESIKEKNLKIQDALVTPGFLEAFQLTEETQNRKPYYGDCLDTESVKCDGELERLRGAACHASQREFLLGRIPREAR